VHHDWRAAAHAKCLHCYAGAIHGDQLTFDHCVRDAAAITDVDSPPVESLVVRLAM
jgi:hypothetical protein